MSRIRRTRSSFVLMWFSQKVSPNSLSISTLSSRTPSERGTIVPEHLVRRCIRSSFSNLHIWHISSIGLVSEVLDLWPGRRYVPVSILAFMIPFLTSYVHACNVSQTGCTIPILSSLTLQNFIVDLFSKSSFSFWVHVLCTASFTDFFHLYFVGRVERRLVILGRSYNSNMFLTFMKKLCEFSSCMMSCLSMMSRSFEFLPVRIECKRPYCRLCISGSTGRIPRSKWTAEFAVHCANDWNERSVLRWNRPSSSTSVCVRYSVSNPDSSLGRT